MRTLQAPRVRQLADDVTRSAIARYKDAKAVFSATDAYCTEDEVEQRWWQIATSILLDAETNLIAALVARTAADVNSMDFADAEKRHFPPSGYAVDGVLYLAVPVSVDDNVSLEAGEYPCPETPTTAAMRLVKVDLATVEGVEVPPDETNAEDDEVALIVEATHTPAPTVKLTEAELKQERKALRDVHEDVISGLANLVDRLRHARSQATRWPRISEGWGDFVGETLATAEATLARAALSATHMLWDSYSECPDDWSPVMVVADCWGVCVTPGPTSFGYADALITLAPDGSDSVLTIARAL